MSNKDERPAAQRIALAFAKEPQTMAALLRGIDGKSVEQVAKASNIPAKLLEDLETGYATPVGGQAVRLASVLRCKPEEIQDAATRENLNKVLGRL